MLFSDFILRIHIKTDLPVLYQAWATPAGIESWFLRKAGYTDDNGVVRKPNEFVAPGDHYTWLWYGYDDSVAEQNEVLEADGQAVFKFGFSGGCIVTIELKKQDNGLVCCTLTQQMPQKEESDRRHFFIECQKGWTFYLANLKSICEGGLDLRNRDVSLGLVVNA
ncbi:MAG: SRPBCC domain-containing protein [Saprospiraceae bacterium]|nr:SRPBCC domain-containing protein [Saprospiraceae bacterium]